MNATLTYNLPEEQDAFEAAVHAADMVIAIRAYLYTTRQKLKHSDMNEDEARVVERCRTELLSELEAMGVAGIIHR